MSSYMRTSGVGLGTSMREEAMLPAVVSQAPQGLKLAFCVNFGFHEWYQAMIPYMQARASQYGATIVVMDADADTDTQLRQLRMVEERGFDAVVLAPTDETRLAPAVALVVQGGTVVVCESSLVRGAHRYVATCDYDMGYALGLQAGGRFTRAGEQARLLDVTYPSLASVGLRSQGFWDGLLASGAGVVLVDRVDGRAQVAESETVTADTLARHRDVNLVFGMDDESAVGAARAILHAAPAIVPVVVGCGFSGPLGRRALADAANPYEITGAMFPEYVGIRCVDACVAPLNGTEGPERWITPFAVVERFNLDDWFETAEAVERWRPRLEAVATQPTSERCSRG